jgi:polar amino acid transport system substrate-binding protein
MNRITRGRFLVVVGFCLGLAFASALAVSSPILDRVVNNGVLKVGLSGNQAPLNAKTRTGQLIGLEVDLANILASAMEVKVEFVEMPFPQLLPALQKGEVDIVMSGVTITAKRTADFAFVGPYMLSGKSILTKSKTLAKADDAGDVNKSNLTVTALANSTSQDFVEKNLPNVTLATSDDYDDAVKMVLEGRADALVADMPACVLSTMRYPGEDLVTLATPLTIEPIGIVIPAGDAQFLNLVENYYRTLEGMGTMQQLRQKWLEDDSWVAALP